MVEKSSDEVVRTCLFTKQTEPQRHVKEEKEKRNGPQFQFSMENDVIGRAQKALIVYI